MLGNNRRSLFHFNNYYSFFRRREFSAREFIRSKERRKISKVSRRYFDSRERTGPSFLLKHCETLQVRVNIDNVIEIFPSLNICVNVRCISIVSNSKYLERLSKARVVVKF